MSAVVDRAGRVQQIDGRAEPPDSINEADVQKPDLLVRLLRRILDDVAALKRRPAPRRVTFPPRVVLADGTTKYRFPHAFGTIPDVLIVRWDGAAAPNFRVDASSDSATLVLTSRSAGTATVRLEAL